MSPMNLPNGISPQEEVETRIIAMLLGEADEFEITELEALLSKDSSLQAFHDEMARSIDVVGEAAVSIGPVGAPDAPKLSPSRRHEIEQAWGGSGSVSAKTTTVVGSLAKMHPLVPLAIAAGVGLAAGTALVNYNNEEPPEAARSEAPADPSLAGSAAVQENAVEPSEISENLARRSVFDIPEGAGREALGAEAPAPSGVDQELLENELRNLPETPSGVDVFAEAEQSDSHLELARRNGDFSFDPQGLSGESRENPIGSGAGHPGVFAFGPPNAIALGDLGQVSPVPNAPTGLSADSFATDSFHPSVTGVIPESGLPETGSKPSSEEKVIATAETADAETAAPPAAGNREKRELLAQHVVLASYKGSPFRTCRGRTGRCPKDCGGSGEFATFAVEKYVEYQKPGKYGSAKQTSHLIQISDFHRNPIGNPEIRKVIMELKEGDHVMLAWNHDYVTRNGSSSPDRPVKELRRLTKAEEKAHFPR